MTEHKKLKLDYFSAEKVYLMAEVNRHPTLCEILQRTDKEDWPAQVGEIAAYCNVWMDGNYYAIELEPLYRELNFKLKKKRTLII